MYITSIDYEQTARTYQLLQNGVNQASPEVNAQTFLSSIPDTGETDSSGISYSTTPDSYTASSAITDLYLGLYSQLILQDTVNTSSDTYPFTEQQDNLLSAIGSRLIRIGNYYVLDTSDDSDSSLPAPTTPATIAIEAYRQAAILTSGERTQLLESATASLSLLQTGLLPDPSGLLVNETETTDIPPNFFPCIEPGAQYSGPY